MPSPQHLSTTVSTSDNASSPAEASPSPADESITAPTASESASTVADNSADDSNTAADVMTHTTQAPRVEDLAQRRRALKAKRKFKFYATTWRIFLMGCFAVGAVKLASSPIWLIRSADQIEVNDLQLLSEETVRDILPVPYPQSLLKVQPDQLAESLIEHAPIEDAVVSRRLLPPGLTVKVTERQPVAIALPDPTTPIKAIPDQPIAFQEPGLLDAQGYWMPRNSYAELGAIASPPTLTVIGMQPSYETAWRNLYQSVTQSPVEITTIDWRNASNVILGTELGAVHIGPYNSQFSEQLAALDQLRELRTEVDPDTVAFINLQNPEKPVIEVLQAKQDPADSL